MQTCLAGLCAAWLAACAAAPLLPADDGPPDRHVHVRNNGWHTEILAPRPAVAATGLLPEAAYFPDAAILAFGWGEQDYYPAPEATLGLTLRAALLPTPSVIHVAGGARLPEGGDGARIVRVPLTEAGFRGLVRAIAGTFDRSGTGPAEPVAPGLSPGGRFYRAKGRFHLFNTCNTWTARMLRAGGVPITFSGVITAGDVMGRLRAVLE